MEYPNCKKCKSSNTYRLDDLFICPDCFYEWSAVSADEEVQPDTNIVKDANGNLLSNGDSVVVIKNLPVKGSPQSIKAGTKVKNIKLKNGDHNIDCKIDGFGAISLKSEFVKKA